MKAKLTVVVLISFLAVCAQAANYGHYIGSVKTEWLDDGRKMRLLDSFVFVDRNGEKWLAPKGWEVDGASIPKFAWSIIGGPFEGKYRSASVIHDVGCDQKEKPWEKVHEVFFWAMLASEVPAWRAKIMYGAVYHFGPRWPKRVIVRNLPENQVPIAKQRALEGMEAGSTAEIVDIRRKYQNLAGIRIPTGFADFDIDVQPPSKTLSESDFEMLKKEIEEREQSASGGLTLSDIRSFKRAR